MAIKQTIDYESRIRDNPLALLEEIEKLMHVPRRAEYPIIALIQTLSNLFALRQGEKEGMQTYLERFKSERNVVVSLFGKGILDGHVKNTTEYIDLTSTIVDASDLRDAQKEMKKKALKNSGDFCT